MDDPGAADHEEEYDEFAEDEVIDENPTTSTTTAEQGDYLIFDEKGKRTLHTILYLKKCAFPPFFLVTL